jgi:hypothetical protein
MQKDITVSKLSRLQKRILIHARRQMLAKGQKIEPRNDVTVNIPAPPWLDEILTKTLSKIFEIRRKHFGALRHEDKQDVHDFIWFFEEVAFFEQSIRDAVKEAGHWKTHNIQLTELYQLAIPGGMAIGILATCKFSIHPWPYYEYGRWSFRIGIKDLTADQIRDNLKDWDGEDVFDKTGIWLDAKPDYPLNCTIPEMLRDLFDFPVVGPIDALAFSPEQIGKARYQSAQAALRRACIRLKARGLIWERAGQRIGLSISFYDRSGIGLTEHGVAVADGLLQTESQEAEADLNLTPITTTWSSNEQARTLR